MIVPATHIPRAGLETRCHKYRTLPWYLPEKSQYLPYWLQHNTYPTPIEHGSIPDATNNGPSLGIFLNSVILLSFDLAIDFSFSLDVVTLEVLFCPIAEKTITIL